MDMDSAQVVFAIVDKDGEEILVKLLFA